MSCNFDRVTLVVQSAWRCALKGSQGHKRTPWWRAPSPRSARFKNSMASSELADVGPHYDSFGVCLKEIVQGCFDGRTAPKPKPWCFHCCGEPWISGPALSVEVCTSPTEPSIGHGLLVILGDEDKHGQQSACFEQWILLSKCLWQNIHV